MTTTEPSKSKIRQAIDLISKDKGIDRNIVIRAIIMGVVGAIHKKYGTYRDIEAKYNEETDEIELFEFKKVVEDAELEDDLIEITKSEALELDPEVQVGEQIGTSLDIQSFGRIHVQAAMQTMFQNLRKAEHDIIFNEFEKRKGEVASGIVRRVDPGMIVVDLGRTEAYIPRREQIPGEAYNSGDRIQGYLLEVRQTTKGPRIIMSRSSEKYLIKLFESEIPEVYEGIVKIAGAVREPGQRAKMSVYSTDPSVHPVGACVGVKGSRVQNIIQELKNENIDVILWDEDPVQYVCNALAPAKILKVLMDEENKQMQIIVEDDQLSLAIGSRGQNVRLAVRLTGWHLNLVSEKQKKEAIFSLCLLPQVEEPEAEHIFQYGFSSLEKLAEAEVEQVQAIPQFERIDQADKLIESAKNLLEKYKKEGKELPQLQSSKKKTPTGEDLKERAEEILKRELAQLDSQGSSQESSQPESSSQESQEASQPESSSQESSQSEPAQNQEDQQETQEPPQPEPAQNQQETQGSENQPDSQTEENKKEAQPESSSQESSQPESSSQESSQSEPAQNQEDQKEEQLDSQVEEVKKEESEKK